MRRRSAKAQSIYREWATPRRDFVEGGCCCLCGGRADDCHEIVGGAVRANAFTERATWLRVCRTCHDVLQYEPKSKQLALKLLTDPAGFDLEKFHQVWGRPRTAVTAEEIAAKGEAPPNRRIKDVRGRRFGRLVAASFAGVEDKRTFWWCICDCGKAVRTRTTGLTSGKSQGCGCRQKELSATRSTKHGHDNRGQRSATYNSYRRMLDRCNNPKNDNYKYYGGRGITICPQWQSSFEAFLEYMGERPAGKTLDRWPNNNGNYEPGNCRWATRKQQIANRGT